ncbi:GPRMGL2 [Trypoxylus dichotomus]
MWSKWCDFDSRCGLQDALPKDLLVSDPTIMSARILAINASTRQLINCAWWQRQGMEMDGPKKLLDGTPEIGHVIDADYPWYADAQSSPGLRSPKFIESPPNVSYRGWWTYPYYSCSAHRWLVSYSVPIPPPGRHGVSLTYRVKSAHKVKLTDKQLLQWMVPILLVMLIYLSTWTLSATPTAEEIKDSDGLKFKQCTYNWWDHSLGIGEVLFLAWGIRVCYNVRNAESLYNEARLISYAIYNIALVNITMVAFHLLIFPTAGPDIKYLLGFIRTQLSTTVTIALVFGPKVIRVLRGQGDQWDNRARSRGVTASFSLNGIGLVPEDAPDLYQENEELKEEIQKLAAQIEFMKIVHMEMNNRHVKPKVGGYFSSLNAPTIHSPLSKPGCLLSKPPDEL